MLLVNTMHSSIVAGRSAGKTGKPKNRCQQWDPNRRPSSGNTYADVEAAYDYLVAKGIPPNRCPLYLVASYVEVLNMVYICLYMFIYIIYIYIFNYVNIYLKLLVNHYFSYNMVFLFGFMVCIDGLWPYFEILSYKTQFLPTWVQ
jgi:hypothetical protein